MEASILPTAMRHATAPITASGISGEEARGAGTEAVETSIVASRAVGTRYGADPTTPATRSRHAAARDAAGVGQR